MGTKREHLKTSSLVELKNITSKEGVRGARSKTKYTEHNREDLIRDIRYNRKEKKESCLLDLLPSFSGASFFFKTSVSFYIDRIGWIHHFVFLQRTEGDSKEGDAYSCSKAFGGEEGCADRT